VSTGLEIVSENALKNWKELIGPENSSTAKSTAPNSIRA
jgi:hypothetical protein